MKPEEIISIVEAVLFVSDRPLKAGEIAEAIGVSPEAVTRAVQALEREYSQEHRGLMVERVAGGFRMTTKEHLCHYIKEVFQSRPKGKLSRSALETLAIICYKQPVTKAEIEAIRGVNSESSINTLLERGLIAEVGRRHGVGRPILYGTTPEFLCYFGLNSLEDLPPLDEDEPSGAEYVKPLLDNV